MPYNAPYVNCIFAGYVTDDGLCDACVRREEVRRATTAKIDFLPSSLCSGELSVYKTNEALRQRNRELLAELTRLRDRADLCEKYQLLAATYLRENDDLRDELRRVLRGGNSLTVTEGAETL